VHLLTQVFVMVGGTLDLIPLTGVTIPFLSLGGSALLINLVEIGLVLTILQRLESQPV
jgi:rod shape determining protein RodA